MNYTSENAKYVTITDLNGVKKIKITYEKITSVIYAENILAYRQAFHENLNKYCIEVLFNGNSSYTRVSEYCDNYNLLLLVEFEAVMDHAAKYRN